MEVRWVHTWGILSLNKVLLLYSTLESASMYGIQFGIHLGPLFNVFISCDICSIGVKRALIAIPIFCMYAVHVDHLQSTGIYVLSRNLL